MTGIETDAGPQRYGQTRQTDPAARVAVAIDVGNQCVKSRSVVPRWNIVLDPEGPKSRAVIDSRRPQVGARVPGSRIIDPIDPLVGNRRIFLSVDIRGDELPEFHAGNPVIWRLDATADPLVERHQQRPPHRPRVELIERVL